MENQIADGMVTITMPKQDLDTLVEILENLTQAAQEAKSQTEMPEEIDQIDPNALINPNSPEGLAAELESMQ